MNRTSGIIGALSGALWVVLMLIGETTLKASTSVDSSERPATWLEEIADEPAKAVLGGTLEGLGLLMSIVFAAYVSALMVRSGAELWARVAFGGAIAAAAVKIATVVPVVAGLDLADEGMDDSGAALLIAMGDAGFHLAMLPLALFVLGTSVGVLGTGLLARWIGWTGIVVTIGLLFSGSVGVALENVIGFLLLLMWTLALSVVLVVMEFRRVRPAPPTS